MAVLTHLIILSTVLSYLLSYWRIYCNPIPYRISCQRLLKSSKLIPSSHTWLSAPSSTRLIVVNKHIYKTECLEHESPCFRSVTMASGAATHKMLFIAMLAMCIVACYHCEAYEGGRRGGGGGGWWGGSWYNRRPPRCWYRGQSRWPRQWLRGRQCCFDGQFRRVRAAPNSIYREMNDIALNYMLNNNISAILLYNYN